MGHHRREMEVEAVEAEKGVEVEEKVAKEVVDLQEAQLLSECQLFRNQRHHIPIKKSSTWC